MSDLSLQRVGPTYGGSGTAAPFRADVTGAQAVTDAHARFWEATMRGQVYACANQTGVTTQAGLSATTPALTLYNPVGSGVYGVLMYAGGVASVAFAAASIIWIGANTNLVAAAVTGTAGITRNGLLGGSNNSKITALTAATLPAAPVAIATIGVGLTGAITTIPSMATLGRFFDGEIILYPGSAVSFQTSTASGASGFFGEFVWEEVPLFV